MEAYLGVDIGAVGVKAALLVCGRGWPFPGRGPDELGFKPLAAPSAESGHPHAGTAHDGTGGDGNGRADSLFVAPYRRTHGRPMDAVRGLVEELLAAIPAEAIAGLAVTGSGSALVAEALGVRRVNDFQAIARAIGRLHPSVRSVFEMGEKPVNTSAWNPTPPAAASTSSTTGPTATVRPALGRSSISRPAGSNTASIRSARSLRRPRGRPRSPGDAASSPRAT